MICEVLKSKYNHNTWFAFFVFENKPHEEFEVYFDRNNQVKTRPILGSKSEKLQLIKNQMQCNG